MLFLRLVLLVGRYLDLEFLDSLDRFSQLSCILKSPLKRKFIEVINLNADFYLCYKLYVFGFGLKNI